MFDVGAGGPVLIERRDVASHAQGDEDARDTIYRMMATAACCWSPRSAPRRRRSSPAPASRRATSTSARRSKPRSPKLMRRRARRGAEIAARSMRRNFRLAHAMLRVSDLDRSVDFYTQLLGMRVLERREHKKNQFSQAYLGYGEGFAQMALELVFNWAREEPYVRGDAFGHIAIEVRGISAPLRPPRRGRRPDAATAARPAARRKYRRLRRGSRRPSDRTGAAAVRPMIGSTPARHRGETALVASNSGAKHVGRIRGRLYQTHARGRGFAATSTTTARTRRPTGPSSKPGYEFTMTEFRQAQDEIYKEHGITPM